MSDFRISNADRIGAGLGGIADLPELQRPEDLGAGTFGDILSQTIRDASAADNAADGKVQQLAAGVSDDLHGTMISMKEAEISLKLVGSIRNKLVEAFHEIWRTSV